MPNPPLPWNEPVLSYAPGTPERAALQQAIAALQQGELDVPLFVGGKELRTGRTDGIRVPHRREKSLGRYHRGGAAEARQAVEAARAAHGEWSRAPLASRQAVFLRAADLLAGKHRARVNAATMLGQSKTPHQAEIDAACELCDFWRWNVHFSTEMLREQPVSPQGVWNQLELRPLEGFVYAVTPFNFTSIAGNLPTAPALLGNTVVWKPAEKSIASSWAVLEVLREAGLPDGVINLVSGDPVELSDALLSAPELAGVHFTGSTRVFQSIWRTVAERLPSYRGFPRLVGETGGKDFILAHESADVDALAVAIVRGGFEFQGQKCSAASRVYVPDTIWPALEQRLVGLTKEIRLGDPTDFSTFMGAVIDETAFDRIAGYQELGRREGRILVGGGADKREGFFIEPTIVRVEDPKHRLMQEEIFGPVVTVYVYAAARWQETLALVDGTSPYALTGAVFARDRAVLDEARAALRDSAGNFYLNDKPTGAVVGQQPFGGARGSGTNDKAGSALNLWRWVSARAIKETFAPPAGTFRYPYMG